MTNWLQRSTKEMLAWAEASSLRYFLVRGSCCADEFSQTVAARYDLERFGALPGSDHRICDVLVVSGAISERSADALVRIYDEMPEPKWVMAVGTCACSGGLFSSASGGQALPGIASRIPVDVFVAGCPPRPEAIIDGWLSLQDKIQGVKTSRVRQPRRALRDSGLESDEWGLS